MAYISSEKSAQIRKNLKDAFPGWKFAVRLGAGKHSVNVDILEAPIDFVSSRGAQYSVNHYHLASNYGGDKLAALEKIVAICNDGNHDNSDIQSDYFDVGWYVHLNVGGSKPFLYRPAPLFDKAA